MILYFANRAFEIQGVASNRLNSRFTITSDNKTESIEKHVTAFEADILFDSRDRIEIEKIITAGSYVMRHVESKIKKNSLTDAILSSYENIGMTDCFTIIDTEISSAGNSVHIYAEDLGLDLLNDLVYPTSGTKTAADHIRTTIEKTGFVIGSQSDNLVERKYMAWDSISTITERLNEIAAAFECDIFYTFDVEGMTIVRKNVVIKQKRGIDTYETLTIGKNLNNITVKTTVENLATALIATGAEDLSLNGYSYDDGDFYISEGVLYSRTALSNWYRYKHDNGHIYRQFSCNATSQVDLKDEAIKELKKIREPEIDYEVDIAFLPENVGIGDVVYIVDDNADLYVSGRILELKTSDTSNLQTATIGDYVRKTSGISDVVLNLASQFKEFAANRNLYTWMIFADDEDGTNLSLEQGDRLYVGLLVNQTKELKDVSQVTEQLLSKITWQKIVLRDPLNISIESVGGTIFQNKTISTTLSVILTTADETIQTLERLQLFYASTKVKIVWLYKTATMSGYVEATTGVSRDGFAYTFSNPDVRSVSVRCQIVMED